MLEHRKVVVEVLAVVGTVVVIAAGSSKMVVRQVVVGEDLVVDTGIVGIAAADWKNRVGRTA